ncbi:MAG: membrane protein insertase YidC [Candidatus Hydrogenedentota bacterium]
MLDDEQEKQQARNQLIAFVLMSVLLIAWLQFLPKPQPAQQPQPLVGEQRVEAPVSPVDLNVAAAPEAGAEPSGWPYLPPVPEQDNPEADEVVLRDAEMELLFTRIGGRLKRATLAVGEHGNDRIQLVPESPDSPDVEAVYPFGLRFTNEAIRDELDRRRFDVVRQSDREVVFRLTLPGAAVITKTFQLTDSAHVLRALVEYKSLEDAPRILGRDQDPAYILNWGPNVASQDFQKGVRQALIWRVDGKNTTLETAKMAADENGEVFTRRIVGPTWMGVRSAYFLVAMRPEFDGGVGWALGDPHRFRFGVAAPRTEVPAQGSIEHSYEIYLGPMQLKELKAAWPTLDTSLRFFSYPDLMDWFAKMLLQLLNWFYGIVPNYGVAIILLTIVVRTVMFPLTIKQIRSMKRMTLLAPEMEKIKQQYGEDPQEFQRRMMELYKEHGVNPVSGCLPLFLQMPVFIALYRMLWSAYELRGAPFALWIKDLSEPDKLLHIPPLHVVPIFGPYIQYINVLPFLGALAMILSVKLTPMQNPIQNPQQKMMMTLMPIVFSVFCYPLASGLNLYILVSTLLGIAQNYLIHVSEVDKPAKVKPRKRQHFYTAALQKRRQMEREARERKKRKKKVDGDEA